MRRAAILAGLLAATATMLAGAAPTRAAGPTALPDPVKARLVPEAGSIAPGKTFWVDLHLDIIPEWHTYWRNPGDSGLPAEIAWTLPPGFSAGEIVWPVPQRFVLGTIGNYGYSGTADLLVPIAAPPNLQPGGSAHLEANASWLACSEICIPGEATLALDLPVGAAASANPSVAALFARLRQRLPQPAGFATRFAVSGQDLRLRVPAAALAGLDRPSAAFFPFDGNVVDAAAEPQAERRADGLDLVLRRASGPASTLPVALSGVLVLRGEGGAERAYSISAPRVPPPRTGEPGVR